MNPTLLSQALAVAAVLFTAAAFAWRLRIFNALPRPFESAPVRGSARAGMVYALTAGMAPWASSSPARGWPPCPKPCDGWPLWSLPWAR